MNCLLSVGIELVRFRAAREQDNTTFLRNYFLALVNF